MTRLTPAARAVRFHSRSGPLEVTRAAHDDGAYTLDFPARPPAPAPELAGDELTAALGRAPVEILRARDPLLVYERAEDVRALAPDMGKLAALAARGVNAVIVTARGTGADADVDFVSRFFAPAKGVPEDPVTGSAHCTLTPFWAERLGRATLRARQVSRRTGELVCERRGERVLMTGHAVLVKSGTLHL
jgi:PhzF family phenazine biosynthesis protein